MLIPSFFFTAAIVGIVSASAGCTPSMVGEKGFIANFYSYEFLGGKGWEKDFFVSGYKSDLLETVRCVESINFQYSNQPDQKVLHQTIYGYSTTISNYSLELSGYFEAPETGLYRFRLAADNGASLQFGAGQTCCNDASGSESGGFSFKTLGPRGGGGSTKVNVRDMSYSLVKGVYYPVKLVMFNWQGNNGLNLKVTKPSGNIISDFGSQVFQAEFANSN
ncbi:hypothetical protein METBIDRAFT_48200, partial [Metschnikowia bicuspidata var. bicuspidata NRRL YB-4993]